MLKKIFTKTILLSLAILMLFSCVSCDVFKDPEIPLEYGYVTFSSHSAPQITVSEPKHDPSSASKKDSSLFERCTITVTSKGGQVSDVYHWLYQDASITLTVAIGQKNYKVKVEFDKVGNLVTNEYTIDLKKALSANDIAAGTELTKERTYSGGIAANGELHDFKLKSAEREILTKNEGDPCNSYTYTEDTCQTCGYYKTWKESAALGHDFDHNGICTRCNKTKVEAGVETEADTTTSTANKDTASETEQKKYIVTEHWGSVEYKSISSSKLGTTETKLLQLSDLSAVHYITVESSNIHVIKVSTVKIKDRDQGLIEIPYEIYGYGEAVMTVSVVYDSPAKDNDVKKIEATFYISQS